MMPPRAIAWRDGIRLEGLRDNIELVEAGGSHSPRPWRSVPVRALSGSIPPRALDRRRDPGKPFSSFAASGQTGERQARVRGGTGWCTILRCSATNASAAPGERADGSAGLGVDLQHLLDD